MTFIQFLREFPAIFGVIGIIVGGAIMLWVTKKFGPMRVEALNEVVTAYQQQVAAQIELGKIQNEQHIVALNMQKEHWSEELAKMEASRDDYKKQLHDVRDTLGSKNTELQLEVQELQMRPSVEHIQAEQQTFYREMLVTMQSIADAVKAHDASVDERIKPITESCKATAFAMTELVKELRKPLIRGRKSQSV